MKKRVVVLGLLGMFLLSGCGSADAVAGYLAKEIAEQIDDVYSVTTSSGSVDMDTTDDVGGDIPDTVYTEIYQAYGNGDYQSAYEKVNAAIAQYGMNDEFVRLQEEIHTQWTAAVFAEAQNAFGDDYDYESAIQVIQKSGVTGEDVDAEIAKYQEYAPVLLTELTPTKESDYMYVGAAIEGDYTDVNGNIYDHRTIIRPRSRTSNDIAKSESDSYVTYYLYGMYRNFDAVLFRTYSSLSTLDEDWEQGTVAKIYGDDVLLYEGPSITQDTYEQYSIHLNVTGVRELKIVLMGVGRFGESYALYHYYPLLAIANATIQK